jgi:signal transduction histidine kinase
MRRLARNMLQHCREVVIVRDSDRSRARIRPAAHRSLGDSKLVEPSTPTWKSTPVSSSAPPGTPAAPQQPERTRSSGSPRFAALLVLLAGLAFALPTLAPASAGSSFPLLAAGSALSLAGLLILRPLFGPVLASASVFTQVTVFLLLGGIAYLLTHISLPLGLLQPSIVLAVLAVSIATPADPVVPLSAAVAVLVGNFIGSGWHEPSLSFLLAIPGAACLLSYNALRTRRAQRAYAAARLGLEGDIQRLQSNNTRMVEPGDVATAVLAAAGGFASALEPNEILDRIVAGTTAQLSAVGSLLLVWDDVHQTLRVGAIAGPNAPATTDLHNMEVQTGSVPTLRDQVSGEIVPVDPTAFREPLLRSLLQRWKVASIMGTRLERADRLLGLFFLFSARPPDTFTHRDHQVLSGITVHAIAALAHANLIADLRNAHQLKEEFMATMSHELRTPLNVIIGYTDLQIDGVFGELSEEHLDAVRRTREQGIQLLELIQATLDMSRLERGLVNVDLREVSISHFVEQLQTQIPSSWRKPTVELSWRTGTGLPSIRTDPQKLQIMLRNLIHNALKFTNHGVVSVSVSTRPAQEEVTFVVQDSGIGIRAEYLSEIFEMFRQISPADTVPGGVGLGLYIVRRFAHVLGADIEVSSAPGRGTTFRVHLPVGGPLAALQRPKKAEQARV